MVNLTLYVTNWLKEINFRLFMNKRYGLSVYKI